MTHTLPAPVSADTPYWELVVDGQVDATTLTRSEYGLGLRVAAVLRRYGHTATVRRVTPRRTPTTLTTRTSRNWRDDA